MTDRSPSVHNRGSSSLLTDPEILQFTRELNLDVLDAKHIGSLTGGRLAKRCYLLQLADGRKLKLRRLRSPERAREVETILRTVGHSSFPEVLARRGSLVLEPWVEGSQIDRESAETAEQCGQLLGEFHTRTLRKTTVAASDLSIEEQLTRLEKARQFLSDSQLLSEKQCQTLVTAARQYQPDAVEQGCIHGDLAPENIVADRQGNLIAIDNEQVAEHPYDYDLARTWLRWPMAAHTKRRFLEGYGCHRRTTSFQRWVHFWLICALTRAVAFRVENSVADSQGRLDQLLLLIRKTDTDPETLLFTWNSDV